MLSPDLKIVNMISGGRNEVNKETFQLLSEVRPETFVQPYRHLPPHTHSSLLIYPVLAQMELLRPPRFPFRSSLVLRNGTWKN